MNSIERTFNLNEPTAAERQEHNRNKLRKACEQFEALFMSHMLKVMRESNGGEGESGGLSLGKNNPLQGMFDWELAKQLSKQSPLGITNNMLEYFDRFNSVSSSEFELKPLDLDKLTVHRARNMDALKTSKAEPDDIDTIITKASRRYHIDEEMIRAVIMAESAGDSNAVSRVGAKGLMQLMDSTAAEMGVKDPFDPSENVNGGTAYLRKMLDRFQGDNKLALAAYNAGPSAVDRYAGVPPYRETQNYVSKVINEYNRLLKSQDTEPVIPTGDNDE